MDLNDIKKLRDEAIEEITYILDNLESKTDLEIFEASYSNLSGERKKGDEFDFKIIFESI